MIVTRYPEGLTIRQRPIFCTGCIDLLPAICRNVDLMKIIDRHWHRIAARLAPLMWASAGKSYFLETLCASGMMSLNEGREGQDSGTLHGLSRGPAREEVNSYLRRTALLQGIVPQAITSLTHRFESSCESRGFCTHLAHKMKIGASLAPLNCWKDWRRRPESNGA